MKKESRILFNNESILLIFCLLISNFLTIRLFKNIFINDIKILGTKYITKEDLLKNSSLVFPTRLIFVKTKFIEKELKENLSLKNISIDRQLFPFGLQVRVQTRKPFAYGEKIENGIKVEGYVDEDGFFIRKEFADNRTNNIYQVRIVGWNKKISAVVSKILKSYKNQSNELQAIYIDSKNFIILKEKKLNKVLLGFNHSNIDFQLNIISEIKSQLSKKKFVKEIESLDLIDPNYPKIKVFKP